MLKNKVILITGSTNGIGTATARHCVAQGAKVMIHGRKEDRAKRLVSELGNAAHYLIADLADESAYGYLISETLKKFGRLDGLVNNAGVYPRNNIDSASLALCHQIMQINFYAPLLLIKEAVKIFRKNKTAGAAIVNIGSINAYCGQPDLLIYSASKGALMTMTRNLADALGPDHIRVNQLNVGWTPTDNEVALKRKEGLPDNWQERIPRVYAPRGRLLSPDEVAAQVVFWLSDQSSPVSGAVYEVEQYPIIGRNRLNDLVIS